ncbi:MAG: hypothetical protein R6V58_13735 [Planctomycetota bacterium]
MKKERYGVLLMAATCLGAATLGARAFGADEGGRGTYLPGGKEVRKAVEARRGKTALSKLAASMKPGAWAELKTEMPKGLWSSPKVDGGRNKGGAGGLHIAGWTNDAHWDSRTGQFLYMGLRQTRRFIAYSEEKNAWRSIPLDPKSDNPVFQQRYGHIYGTNAFDHERSRFYHLYRGHKKKGLTGGISFFDVQTEKWTKLPPRPKGSGGMAIEWFGAMDGLVVLGGKQTYLFSTERQKWEPLGPSPIDGYHSLFRHNPFRDELLMAGGNHNPKGVARLTKEGKIERLKDAPVNLSVGSDRITVDPVTGRYLIRGGDKGEKKKLYEFDSAKNEYRVVEGFTAGWPYHRYAMPVGTFIPEYGVIMWAERRGVYLYKHIAPAAENAKSQPEAE